MDSASSNAAPADIALAPPGSRPGGVFVGTGRKTGLRLAVRGLAVYLQRRNGYQEDGR